MCKYIAKWIIDWIVAMNYQLLQNCFFQFRFYAKHEMIIGYEIPMRRSQTWKNIGYAVADYI